MDFQIDFLSIAQIAYDAYGKSVNFKNYQGKDMPPFENLPEAIKTAWCAAVEATLSVNVLDHKKE